MPSKDKLKAVNKSLNKYRQRTDKNNKYQPSKGLVYFTILKINRLRVLLNKRRQLYKRQ